MGGAAPDLELTCEVDGVMRQHSRTSQLIFGPTDVVAYLSDVVTLRPGDLDPHRHTRRRRQRDGPAGVPAGRPGVRTAIEGIGELLNECVPEMP